MANTTFFAAAQFTATKIGASGLTDVFFDIYQCDPATSISGSFLLNTSGSHIGRGIYGCYFTGDEDMLYAAIGVTSSSTVDQKEIPALAVLIQRFGNLNADVNSTLAASAYTIPPTASAIANQVRTELATELGRIDVAISSVVTTGAGSQSVTLTITHNGLAVDGAKVWVSTDSAGSNVIAGTKYSDQNGNVTFMLDVGTYYVWVVKSGIDFGNPNTLTVT